LARAAADGHDHQLLDLRRSRMNEVREVIADADIERLKSEF
jgi:hypothetical protein